MKRFILNFVFVTVSITVCQAQTNDKCIALFSSLAEHELFECTNREYEKLEIYQIDKKSGYIMSEKFGEYQKIAYSYKGNFDKRPSAVQIFQNYSNAITKAGGEVLYKDDTRGLSGKLKKDGAIFWIKVTTDGSGFYWLETVRESGMRQDVVLNAGEIKRLLTEEGRLAFYGIYFDTDKAVVKPESADALKEIAAFLKANPTVSVFVVGHTNNTGDYKRNLQLSKDRTQSVINELITKYGVDKPQLAGEGVASLAPLASNSSEQGRAKNRRVELVLK